MIVYSAFIPHESPTVLAETLMCLRENLYVRNPETIMVISPHASDALLSLSLSVNPTLTTQNRTIRNDLDGVTMLRRETEAMPGIRLTDEGQFEQRTAAPVQFLIEPLKSIRGLSLNTGMMNPRTAFHMGTLLEDALSLHPRRFGLLAIGNFLCADPRNDGTGKDDTRFERTMYDALEGRRLNRILDAHDDSQGGVNRCGLGPLSMLLGVIKSYHWRPTMFADAAVEFSL